MTKPLAAKELRTRLADVIREVQQGTHFILIYRSKPVGELRPLGPSDEATKKGSDPFSLLLNPPKELLFSSKKSAVQLVREDRGNS